MAWNGSGGYIGGLRYGAGSMGARGWHGTRDSNYRAHNPNGRRLGPVATTNSSSTATPTVDPEVQAREKMAKRLDGFLKKADKQVDFGSDATTGGNGITKKELVTALEKAGVEANTEMRGPLALVLQNHLENFATKKTEKVAAKVADGDQAALAALL